MRTSPVSLLLRSSVPGKEEPVLHLIYSHTHFSIEFMDAGKKISLLCSLTIGLVESIFIIRSLKKVMAFCQE